eukprot:3269185-Rhodomonas_salina.1
MCMSVAEWRHLSCSSVYCIFFPISAPTSVEFTPDSPFDTVSASSSAVTCSGSNMLISFDRPDVEVKPVDADMRDEVPLVFMELELRSNESNAFDAMMCSSSCIRSPRRMGENNGRWRRGVERCLGLGVGVEGHREELEDVEELLAAHGQTRCPWHCKPRGEHGGNAVRCCEQAEHWDRESTAKDPEQEAAKEQQRMISKGQTARRKDM